MLEKYQLIAALFLLGGSVAVLVYMGLDKIFLSD